MQASTSDSIALAAAAAAVDPAAPRMAAAAEPARAPEPAPGGGWHRLGVPAVGAARPLRALRLALETQVERRRLAAALPDLAAYGDGRARLWADCLPIYRRWLAEGHAVDETVSLETAGFVLHLLERRRINRVLELGSGLMSLLLRAHAGRTGGRLQVRSTDDDPMRLERTRSALLREGLASEGLVAWPRFRTQREEGFDLLVHRVGATPRAPLSTVLGRVRPGGFLVLEGVEREEVSRAVRRLLSESGFRCWSLRAQTRDCHGRHALLARA